jgi:transposase
VICAATTTEDLLAKVAHLEAELANSQGELANSRKENEALRASQAELRAELELLRRRIYVAKAERVDTRQLELEFATKLAHLNSLAEPSPEFPSILDEPAADGQGQGGRKRKRKSTGRRDLRDVNLPEIRVDIPDPLFEDLVKEGRAVRLGAVLSYKLAWQRGGHRKVVIARTTYRMFDADGETTIVTADLPEESLPHSLAAPSLLANIAKSKFDMGLPLARIERDWRQNGVPVDRGTMSRWMEDAGGLFGVTIVEAMRKESLATAFCISTDATRIAIQPTPDPEKKHQPCRNGNFFVMIADRDHVFFEYTPSETSEFVAGMFKGFKGYIQADAKSVYDILFRPPPDVDTEDITLPKEVGCMTHCRRNFWEAAIALKDATAREALYRIHRFYELEERWKDKPPDEITRLRQIFLRPELEAFFTWARAHYETLKGQRGLLPKAFGYAIRHEAALMRFLEDGRLKIDNNHSERAIRPIAVGRNAWFFVGSDDHATSTGHILSLIASARLHGLDSEAYLRDMLRVLAHWPKDRYIELAPKYWAKTRATLDPVQLAAEIGPLTIPPAPAK